MASDRAKGPHRRRRGFAVADAQCAIPPEFSWDGRIDLRGLRVQGIHGALPKERRQSQPFVVDLSLQCDVWHAATSDDLSQTVDYAAAAKIVAEVIQGQHRILIETLCAEIARRLTQAFPAIRSGEVVVHKPEAPVGMPFADVAVRLTFSRIR